MQRKTHWENVYNLKSADAVSWYQEHADTSLALIRQSSLSLDAELIDVGGGASTLIDDLLRLGYRNLTVLDIAASGLDIARNRLGEHAASVHWLDVGRGRQAPRLPDIDPMFWRGRARRQSPTRFFNRGPVPQPSRPGLHLRYYPVSPLGC